MAVVYKGLDEGLNRHVALKVLSASQANDQKFVTRFQREARGLARLNSPYVAQIYFIGAERKPPFFAMEFVSGRTLREIIEKEERIPLKESLGYLGQMAMGLQAAAENGIIHRDVKPDNVMINDKGQVKLMDFGLVKRAGDESGMTAHGIVLGTPRYMSPEQAGCKEVDLRSDIYSLGATFFHLLTGAPPYNEKTRKAILERHLEGKLPSVSQAGKEQGVPKSLDPVVKRMMAPVPGYRYSATDLVAALEGLKLQDHVRPRQTRRAKAAARKSKAPVGLLVGAGVVVLLVIGLLVVLFTSQGEKVQPLPMNTKKAGTEPEDKEITALDRAKAKEDRDARAKQAFEKAKMYVDQNPNNPGMAIEHYGRVWEEYGETHWGEKARALMKEAEAIRDAEKIAAEKAAKKAAQKTARQKLDEALKAKLDAFDFEAARQTLKDYFFDYDEAKPLVELYNRLEYAEKLIPMLAEEINLNEKKYAYSIFKDGVSDKAEVVGADAEEGILIKEGTLEQRVSWGKLGAESIRRLCERQLGYKDPIKLYLLANFLYVAGEKDQFKEWLQQAKGLDRFGQVEEMEKKVKPK